MTDKFQSFEKQQYLTIETFRKNGQGVKTPVWFVRDGNSLLIWTESGSGKAKRIRRDGRVRITPSTGSGQPLGTWVDAHAIADDSPETVERIVKLLRKKYGLTFEAFRLLGRMRSAAHITLSLRLD